MLEVLHCISQTQIILPIYCLFKLWTGISHDVQSIQLHHVLLIVLNRPRAPDQLVRIHGKVCRRISGVQRSSKRYWSRLRGSTIPDSTFAPFCTVRIGLEWNSSFFSFSPRPIRASLWHLTRQQCECISLFFACMLCIARLICIQDFSCEVAVLFGSCPGWRALPFIIHNVILPPLKVLKKFANGWRPLASHPQFCLMCRYASFRGCVSYDDVSITVSCQQVSISALSEIADTNYRHCVVFASFPPAKFTLSKCPSSKFSCGSTMVRKF